MESERLKRLNEEAAALDDRLSAMTEKASEDYQYVMARRADINRMIREETERLIAERKLQLEEQKAEQETRRMATQNHVEQEKLKVEKRRARAQWIGFASAIAVELLSIVGARWVNNGTIMTSLRANNSGETLTADQKKFIFAKRPK